MEKKQGKLIEIEMAEIDWYVVNRVKKFDHLYHLEHHLYPMVPHKNWPKLAARLDGYFKREGVDAIEFKVL
jgi:fatty acid desaturase